MCNQNKLWPSNSFFTNNVPFQTAVMCIVAQLSQFYNLQSAQFKLVCEFHAVRVDLCPNSGCVLKLKALTGVL